MRRPQGSGGEPGAAGPAPASTASESVSPPLAAAVGGAALPVVGSLAEQVAAFRAGLPVADLDGLSDTERLSALRELELLARAAAGVGVHLQVGFHSCQVESQIAAGVRPSRAGKAVGDDLAAARMTSPYLGAQELTSARALVAQMPTTLAALSSGVISAYQARVITETTTCLEPQDRARVDAALGPLLPGASTREIGALVQSMVYQIDPAGFVDRARKAAKDRGVSIRPCPDVMGLLSARLPAAQAIACYQSLRAAARAKKASGDPRTLAQLMADELYERLTGRCVVDGIDVEVGVIITDRALFDGATDPATLIGYGPIPAQTARDLLTPTDATPTDTDADGEPVETQDEADQSADEAEATDTADEIADETEDDDEAVETDDADEDAHASTATDAAAGPAPTPADVDDAEITRRARADARANAAGFPGATTPPGHCPDGPHCTRSSCTLAHGHPAPTASGTRPPGPPGPPDTQQDSASSDPPPDTPRPQDPVLSSGIARAATVWLRRLYTDPVTGILTDRDNRKRLFTGALRAFLITRDQTCRNSWCGAPIRHIDHIQRHSEDGTTDPDNGRGLCARCNLARERTRHNDPPPESYRPPPPLLPTLPLTQAGPPGPTVPDPPPQPDAA